MDLQSDFSTRSQRLLIQAEAFKYMLSLNVKLVHGRVLLCLVHLAKSVPIGLAKKSTKSGVLKSSIINVVDNW